jgi:hypothetical protein
MAKNMTGGGFFANFSREKLILLLVVLILLVVVALLVYFLVLKGNSVVFAKTNDTVDASGNQIGQRISI